MQKQGKIVLIKKLSIVSKYVLETFCSFVLGDLCHLQSTYTCPLLTPQSLHLYSVKKSSTVVSVVQPHLL